MRLQRLGSTGVSTAPAPPRLSLAVLITFNSRPRKEM